jgi:hypothetical protein
MKIRFCGALSKKPYIDVDVEHNRLFLVDLNALKSKNDIKCDESGCWINNSCNKFKFVKYEDKWTQCDHGGSGSE